MGQWLSDRLGHQFIVENRAGASGNIGTEAVARATPDGYTILMEVMTANALNASLYPNLSFNFVRDIAPVAIIGGAATGRPEGAAVGAVIGGTTGAAIGANAEERHYRHRSRVCWEDDRGRRRCRYR